MIGELLQAVHKVLQKRIQKSYLISTLFVEEKLFNQRKRKIIINGQ